MIYSYYNYYMIVYQQMNKEKTSQRYSNDISINCRNSVEEFINKMAWIIMVHVAWIHVKFKVLDFPDTRNQGPGEKLNISRFFFFCYVLNYFYLFLNILVIYF